MYLLHPHVYVLYMFRDAGHGRQAAGGPCKTLRRFGDEDLVGAVQSCGASQWDTSSNWMNRYDEELHSFRRTSMWFYEPMRAKKCYYHHENQV